MKWLCFLAISVVLALDDDDEGEDIGGGWKKTVNEKGQRVQQMQVIAESGRPGRAELLAKKRPLSRRRRLSAELQNVRETSGKLRGNFGEAPGKLGEAPTLSNFLEKS